MSTPSTALEGIAARPAPAPALKIVPARHPLQVFGTVLALALILIGLQSVLGNPRWGWGTFAEWFFARPVLEGLGRTLLLTALGTGLGFALGTLLALARVSGSPLLSAVSWGYVWLFRSIPLLVLLLLLNNLGYLYSTIELGVPFTGISLFSYPTTQLIGVFTAAVLGLTLNQAAFSAEVIRGGILSVDHGQYEAAARSACRVAPGAPHHPAAGDAFDPAGGVQRCDRPGQEHLGGLRAGAAGAVLHRAGDLSAQPGSGAAADGGHGLVPGDPDRVVAAAARGTALRARPAAARALGVAGVVTGADIQ